MLTTPLIVLATTGPGDSAKATGAFTVVTNKKRNELKYRQNHSRTEECVVHCAVEQFGVSKEMKAERPHDLRVRLGRCNSGHGVSGTS